MNIEEFELFSNSIPDPLCLTGVDGKVLGANQAFCDFVKLPLKDIKKCKLSDLVNEQSSDKLPSMMKNWSGSRNACPARLTFSTGKDESEDVQVYGNAIKLRKDSKPTCLMIRLALKKQTGSGFGALNDKVQQLEKEVRERHQYEMALTESEEQVRLLLNSTKEAIYGIDMDGNCTFVNTACLELLGFETNNELLGKNMHELIHHTHPDGKPYHVEDCLIYQAHIKGQHTQNDKEVFWRKDGSSIPVEYSAQAILDEGNVVGSVITFQDITRRKEIEAELARSQDTLERAQAIAHVGSWDWDIVGGGLYWTDEIYRIFGLVPQEFGATYEAFLNYIHPDDRDAVIEAVNQTVANESVEYSIEHRVARPDGSERTVRERGNVYRNAMGEPIRMIGTVQDITEQKKTETYQTMLFESSPIGLALCDMQGKLIDINPAYARIIGRSIEETKQLTYWEITPEEYAPEEKVQLEMIGKFGYYGPYEKEYLHKDGYRVPVRLLGQIVEFDGDQYIWSSVEDITEASDAKSALQQANLELEDRVRLRTAELLATNEHLHQSLRKLNETQLQLVQSEKMAALGGLVAGVAHEINTPVGVGVTAISHLQMKLDEYRERYEADHMTRDDFESMLNAADEASSIIHNNLDRAAELIRSFKQVAVDQTSNDIRTFDLREYLDEIQQSLKPKLKAGNHSVNIECSSDIQMNTTPGALSQVVTNLIMNSIIHGFDDRQDGKISIKISEKEADWIRIDYADNGKGISQENVQKIFEPFYTTRRGQGGSGLGMHIVYNLVVQTLGGQIECHSIEGEGVVFQLDLPRDISLQESRLKNAS